MIDQRAAGRVVEEAGKVVYGIDWSSGLAGFVPDFHSAIPAHPTARRTTFGPIANPNPGAARVFLPLGPSDLEDPVLKRTQGNGSRVTLTFSEPLYATPATNPANCALLKDGGGGVHVIAAAFGSVSNAIILTTGTALELAATYTVTLNHLTDRAGRPLAAPTQASFHTWDNNPSGVKVFILAGQSNMQGQGKIEQGNGNVAGAIGSLRYEVVNDPVNYGHLVDAGSNWIVRNDVSVWWRTSDLGAARTVRKGNLTTGFGVDTAAIGPEYGFGWIMGDFLTEPVLLIKAAWGGKSLAGDFRPPSAVVARGGAVGPYHNGMIDYAHDVLDHLDTEFPAYAGMGYQIAGFGWHQLACPNRDAQADNHPA